MGAGVISNNGDAPTASLDGSYETLDFGAFPVSESDNTVGLLHAVDDNVFVGVFGGGVKLLFADRSGLRVDVRVHVGDGTIRTLLDARPDVVEVPPGILSFPLASLTDPGIQISNDSTIAESTFHPVSDHLINSPTRPMRLE